MSKPRDPCLETVILLGKEGVLVGCLVGVLLFIVQSIRSTRAPPLKRFGYVVPDARVASIMTDGCDIRLQVSCTLDAVSKSWYSNIPC